MMSAQPRKYCGRHRDTGRSPAFGTSETKSVGPMDDADGCSCAATNRRTCYPTRLASSGSSATNSPAIDSGTSYRRRSVRDDRAVWSRASGAVHAAGADNSISFRNERNEQADECHGGRSSDRCHTKHQVSSCVKRQLSAHTHELITQRPPLAIDPPAPGPWRAAICASVRLRSVTSSKITTAPPSTMGRCES
jgi:hypothetical protein